MFFLSILTDSPYYHKGYPHNGWDYLLSALGVGLGALVMMLLPDNGDGFIYGTFVAVLANVTLFSIRYAKCGKPETVETEE